MFLAEMQLDPLYEYYPRSCKNPAAMKPLPRFPAVERDFSLLLADGTHFSDVGNAIRSLSIGEI